MCVDIATHCHFDERIESTSRQAWKESPWLRCCLNVGTSFWPGSARWKFWWSTPNWMKEKADSENSGQAHEDHSVSMLRANIGALVLVAPPVALLTTLFIGIHGLPALYLPLVDASLTVCAALLISGIVAHEVLHAIAWKVAASPPKGAVRLGFQWKTFTPYAHCSVAMTARAYRIGAVAPGIALGLVPMIVALVFGWGGWMNYGILFTMAAGGDALIIWLLRGVPGGRMVIDHPSRAGCLLLDEVTRPSTENVV